MQDIMGCVALTGCEPGMGASLACNQSLLCSLPVLLAECHGETIASNESGTPPFFWPFARFLAVCALMSGCQVLPNDFATLRL
jgi:hypothetical protein